MQDSTPAAEDAAEVDAALEAGLEAAPEAAPTQADSPVEGVRGPAPVGEDYQGRVSGIDAMRFALN